MWYMPFINILVSQLGMIFTFKKRFDSVIHSESPSSSWGPSILLRVLSGQA